MIYWQLFVLVSASIRVPYRAYISRDLNFANDSNIGFRGSYFRETVPAHNKCLLRDWLIFANGTRIRTNSTKC